MNKDIKAIIEAVNKADYYSVIHVEDGCEEFNTAVPQPKQVAEGLEVDKHRWYEISTSVYEIGGDFFGLRGPTQMYSESGCWEDLSALSAIKVEAFEVKPVQVTTYERI